MFSDNLIVFIGKNYDNKQDIFQKVIIVYIHSPDKAYARRRRFLIINQNFLYNLQLNNCFELNICQE